MSRKYRNRPTIDYTVLRNAALRNPDLSLKAKGALALMLSFPADWEYHLDHLESMSRDGRDSLRSAVRELEAHGYIKRTQTRKPDGTLADAEYHVTDDLRTVDGKPGDGHTVDGLTVAGKAVHGESPENAHARVTDGTSTVDGKTVAGKPAATKTNYTKTEPTKTEETKGGFGRDFDPSKVDLPAFVSPGTWADFVEHRREIRKRLTAKAVSLILADLAKTPADADAMLRQTIASGWTGVFPINSRGPRARSPDAPREYADVTADDLLAPSNLTGEWRH